jgi:TetR/AcrR family transcriptional regulator, regulator of cefoperazone and chloramphenicol sensitivity
MQNKKAQSKRVHARAEVTRQELLDAALELFSTQGFERVSTRELAAAAGTTLSSIQYHFGSKEGLYETVLESIDARIREELKPVVRATEELLSKKSVTRLQKLEALMDLVSAHARVILSSGPRWTALVVHEQLRYAELMEPRFDVPAMETILTAMRLVATLRKQPVRNAEVRLQTIMLFGRASIIKMFRSGTYSLMERQELTPAHNELIVKLIRTEIRAIFG